MVGGLASPVEVAGSSCRVCGGEGGVQWRWLALAAECVEAKGVCSGGGWL